MAEGNGSSPAKWIGVGTALVALAVAAVTGYFKIEQSRAERDAAKAKQESPSAQPPQQAPPAAAPVAVPTPDLPTKKDSRIPLSPAFVRLKARYEALGVARLCEHTDFSFNVVVPDQLILPTLRKLISEGAAGVEGLSGPPRIRVAVLSSYDGKTFKSVLTQFSTPDGKKPTHRQIVEYAEPVSAALADKLAEAVSDDVKKQLEELHLPK